MTKKKKIKLPGRHPDNKKTIKHGRHPETKKKTFTKLGRNCSNNNNKRTI